MIHGRAGRRQAAQPSASGRRARGNARAGGCRPELRAAALAIALVGAGGLSAFAQSGAASRTEGTEANPRWETKPLTDPSAAAASALSNASQENRGEALPEPRPATADAEGLPFSKPGTADGEERLPEQESLPLVREQPFPPEKSPRAEPLDGATTSGGSLKTYRIGIGDVLQVNVWREPEVSAPSIVVRSDGKISLPLIKEVQVLGLTPVELEQGLTAAFSRFIHAPDVTVIVQEIRSEKVYVVGGVTSPGSIQLASPMTVLQVLAEAGGLTEFAKRNKIHVLRTQGDRQVRLPFRYEDVIKGKASQQNVWVLPGDTIVVPQ